MLAAFSRFFFAGKRRLHGFARRMAGNAARGPRCMGSAWRSGPYWRLSCRFSRFAAPFRAFSATSRCFERPHSRVFRQPGKKTLQWGPMAAFSAAELLLARVDSAWLLSSVRGRIVASVVRIVALGPRIVALVSAKYHLCVRGPSCSKAFLCRFVANTCGFLVRVHGVR